MLTLLSAPDTSITEVSFKVDWPMVKTLLLSIRMFVVEAIFLVGF
jgi:hypothetical protein